MIRLEIVIGKIPTRAVCAALAFVVAILPVISARAQAAGEDPEIACDHANIKLESFYTVTIDLAPVDQVTKSETGDAAGMDNPGKEGSGLQTLTLDIVLHKDSESVTRRLNARLLGQSLTDVLRNSQRDAYGLIELHRDPAIAEATKEYHDYIGPLAGHEGRDIPDLTLLMCNTSICKVEVGRPILLNQRPVYLLFGLRPEHLPAWKHATLALISQLGRWCTGTH